MARYQGNANTPAPKEETKSFEFPEGRMINNSLKEKDAFKANEKSTPGKPSYKAEMAFDDNDLMKKVMDDVWEEVANKYGDDAVFDIDAQAGDKNVIISPFKIGDEMAEKREKKGKVGDAYKGKIVIRFDTIYNFEGMDMPGGAAVHLEDVTKITLKNQEAWGQIWNGIYGIIYGNLHFYVDNDGNNAFKFYYKAFQKTREGEKLSTGSDTSALFKPVGRPAAAAGGEGGRRRRAG